jgi:hypothetical protein
MVKTTIAPHGLFYMENSGGCRPADPQLSPSTVSIAAEEHQPSCFAGRRKRAKEWKGGGAM